jgi:response regulator RpfG family c-di-GMP phosphodiesterase
MLKAAKNYALLDAQTKTWNIFLLLGSSQLCAIGKISKSRGFLKKPGLLSEAWFQAMKKQVTLGAAFIEKLAAGENDSDFLNEAKVFAQFHHKKRDGRGCPKGANKDIPLLGLLTAIDLVYEDYKAFV